jgi:hypothetical protein
VENVAGSNVSYDHPGELAPLGRSQRKLYQGKRGGMKAYGTSTAKSKMDVEQRMTDSNKSYSASELRLESQATFVSEQRNMYGSMSQQNRLQRVGTLEPSVPIQELNQQDHDSKAEPSYQKYEEVPTPMRQ